MARPRTIDDAAVLAAALQVIQSVGPGAASFAAVSQASGLAPATLVQRFGTREGLVRAALLQAWDQLDAATLAQDRAQPETPAGAVALLLALSDYGDHEQFAEGLTLLREDMRDAALRARGEQWGAALFLALGRRLTADAARQLALGRLMASHWQGALIWWGFSRQGEVRTVLRYGLEDWCRAVGLDRERGFEGD